MKKSGIRLKSDIPAGRNSGAVPGFQKAVFEIKGAPCVHNINTGCMSLKAVHHFPKYLVFILFFMHSIQILNADISHLLHPAGAHILTLISNTGKACLCIGPEFYFFLTVFCV